MTHEYLTQARKRLLVIPFLVVLGASPTARAAQPWLETMVPDWTIQPPESTDSDASRGWSSFAVRDGALIVEASAVTIPAPYVYVGGEDAEKLIAGDEPRSEPRPYGRSLLTPHDSLMLVRIQANEGMMALAAGTYPSLSEPQDVDANWTSTAILGNQRWHFAASTQTRADGRMLDGSLAIQASSERDGTLETPLLPAASGMAIQRQRLLWLGDVNDDGIPDLIVERTWVTGEMDRVLVIWPMIAVTYVPTDDPATYFASGVDPESNRFVWHRGQTVPSVLQFEHAVTFAIGEEAWARRWDPERKDAPQVMAQEELTVDGEALQVRLEYTPRVSAAPSSAGNYFWDGSVLVRIIYRDQEQVLLQTGQPDGDAFSFTFGLASGKPAIRIRAQPHYNNRMTHEWRFDQSTGRFRQTLRIHEQGC